MHPKMPFFTKEAGWLLEEEDLFLALAFGLGPGFALQAAGLFMAQSKLFAFLLEMLWCARASYSSKLMLGLSLAMLFSLVSY